MNKPTIDFYFDFISPYSYLAATRIKLFEQQHAVSFNWLPVNLPRLIKLSGNTSPANIKSKAIYSLRDLKRWALWLDVPLKMIRPGSFDSRAALRISCALEGKDRAEFSLAVFDALWSGSVDPGNQQWLQHIFELKGLPQQWLKQADEGFESNTLAALKAGAFGVPTFVLHPRSGRRSELLFGIDHMDFLARACKTGHTHTE